MNRILSILKNKYYVAFGLFLVWMFVFDRNDIITQYQHHSKLKNLENQREYYIKDIARMQKDLNDLTTDQARLEKFAREKYLMKKDNEDVFLIVKVPKPEVKKK